MDRPSHEEPSGEVKERQAALGGRLTQPADDLVNVGLGPVAPHFVEVGRALVALAVAACGQAKPGQQCVHLSARPAGNIACNQCLYGLRCGWVLFVNVQKLALIGNHARRTQPSNFRLGAAGHIKVFSR